MPQSASRQRGDPPEPSVSVVIPCRNERAFIEACVLSIFGQDLPAKAFEVIVADGMSDDGTREILERLASEHSRLRVVDNVRQITPCGRNAGVRVAQGRFIAILDAHTTYAPGYLRACRELLDEHPEALCSGGPIVSRGRNAFGRAVAAVMAHPFGVGNATHRFPDFEGYAEGACFPMFRREVFDQIGWFDERLVRNQDDEFNYRLARAGGKVFISPRARCTYFVRETPAALFRQYFQYGFWRVAVLRIHRLPARLRHVAPIGFFAGAGGLLVAVPVLSGWWRALAAAPLLLYLVALSGIGVQMVKQEGVRVGILAPLAAATMHLAYAAGFTMGVAAGRRQLAPRRGGAADGGVA